jgi:hypothetical protein
LIQKEREKKNGSDVLMQKRRFLGLLFSFFSKKFGYSKEKLYLCTNSSRHAS